MPHDHPIDELLTLRDWLRYGVSRFEAETLVYGHGTANAFDEAAFLILSALNLPPDPLEPWLPCRLTHAERSRVYDLIEQRVATRKPASYLTGTAWIGGYKFAVNESTIVPRSYIGELLVQDGLSTAVGDGNAVGSILELCTGSGCLAILAALRFPAANVTATDISPAALGVAGTNIAAYELAARIRLIQSDLFEAIPSTRFDLIIANPPYVPSATVLSFPPEYRAEPAVAHDGGADGMVLVRRILEQARTWLTKSGVIVVEVGEARELLEAAYPELPFLWLDTAESEGEVFALNASDLAFLKSGKPVRGRGASRTR